MTGARGMSTPDASTDLAASRDGSAWRGPAVTFATTEHFNLQAARALTVSEATVAPASTSLPCPAT
jgi:hypothetical protein